MDTGLWTRACTYYYGGAGLIISFKGPGGPGYTQDYVFELAPRERFNFDLVAEGRRDKTKT